MPDAEFDAWIVDLGKLAKPRRAKPVRLAPAELLAAVKDECLARYNTPRYSYDTMVECWSDDDYRECIGSATTLRAAMREVSRTAKLIGEQRDSVRAEIF